MVHPNMLVTQILRAPLLGLAEPIKLSTDMQPDITGSLPFAHVRHVSGSEVIAELGDWAAIVADVYAADDTTAWNGATEVRRLFFAAWKTQTEYAAGYVGMMQTPVPPFPFPRQGMPGDLYRYTAEYRLLLRPSRVPA